MLNLAIFDTFPEIKTERLWLRKIISQDKKAIFEMRASSRVNQFIGRENMENDESAEDLIQRVSTAYDNKTAIAWAGVLRGKGDIIGTCGFNHFDMPNMRAEIGGELSVNYWGKNIAFEAVEALVNFGFETINLHTIEAKVSPENRGVIFILEALGFEKEAHFRDRVYFKGAFSDMAVYSCIR